MPTDSHNDQHLIDPFSRRINYLRISVTDRCDFRCVYCMEEQMSFVSRQHLLSLEELAQIAEAFAALGVHKIRITGGEPLVRRNIIKLFEHIGRLPGVTELVTTTNGSQLSRMAADLKAAGLQRINISLDTLQADRFKRITRIGDLNKVLRGIEVAREVGFAGLKLNTVILKNVNDDEIIDLVCFAGERGMDISFIEEMPLGAIKERDRLASYMPSYEILKILQQRFELVASTDTTGGPARYYRLLDYHTRVGFISPHSDNFCASCNRVRLTCEGRLLLCLGQEHSVDLRAVIRAYPNDLDKLKNSIREAMQIKPKGHDFDLAAQPLIFRHMNVTGG